MTGSLLGHAGANHGGRCRGEEVPGGDVAVGLVMADGSRRKVKALFVLLLIGEERLGERFLEAEMRAGGC